MVEEECVLESFGLPKNSKRCVSEVSGLSIVLHFSGWFTFFFGSFWFLKNFGFLSEF